jgi:DHA3 family macrolide efflux protein-like MFS transporter
MTGNLMTGIAFTVLAPMILARTANNQLAFASVQSAGAIGGIVGGLVMSTWGGFKRRVHGVLLGWALASVFQVMFGLGRGLPIWLPAIFVLGAFIPLIDGSNQAIWQAKVAPDVQGRVFSARSLIAGIMQPLAPLIAGPLADFILEPGMRVGGSLSPVFSWLVGIGPGTGMALIFIFTGLLASLAGLGGYLFPAVRNAEDILPDHDAASTAPAAAG